eukprot:COSAG06_NODE_1720_length_8590_cov_12.038865_2_plen_182_part_00
MQLSTALITCAAAGCLPGCVAQGTSCPPYTPLAPPTTPIVGSQCIAGTLMDLTTTAVPRVSTALCITRSGQAAAARCTARATGPSHSVAVARPSKPAARFRSPRIPRRFGLWMPSPQWLSARRQGCCGGDGREEICSCSCPDSAGCTYVVGIGLHCESSNPDPCLFQCGSLNTYSGSGSDP